jgi:hypothetical protein
LPRCCEGGGLISEAPTQVFIVFFGSLNFAAHAHVKQTDFRCS